MRKSEIKRKTNETDIYIKLNIDGKGKFKIDTGLPFFDHMLSAFSKHSNIDIELKAVGDIEIDYHHTIEDTGIALGKALNEALGDKRGINRFSSATVPLDEALARASLDISGRAYLSYNVDFTRSDDGSSINPYLFEEFFRGFVNTAQITLHIDLIRGNNSHHIIEAVFKALANVFKNAVRITGSDMPSTKGII